MSKVLIKLYLLKISLGKNTIFIQLLLLAMRQNQQKPHFETYFFRNFWQSRWWQSNCFVSFIFQFFHLSSSHSFHFFQALDTQDYSDSLHEWWWVCLLWFPFKNPMFIGWEHESFIANVVTNYYLPSSKILHSSLYSLTSPTHPSKWELPGFHKLIIRFSIKHGNERWKSSRLDLLLF